MEGKTASGRRAFKGDLVLGVIGLLPLASLCITSGASWMLPQLINHYGPGASLFTTLPTLASALGLLVSPIITRKLRPVSVISGTFMIMAAASLLLVPLPSLGLALAASFGIGLFAIAIGPIHAAAPERAGTTPEHSSTILIGVFNIGTMIASYGVATVAKSLGISLGFGFLGLLSAIAAVGAWLIFGTRRLTRTDVSVQAATPKPAQVQQSKVWTADLVTIMVLAALNKMPIGAVLATLATVLEASKTYSSPIWLAVANGGAVVAGLIHIFWWSKRVSGWNDNGVMRAALITLVGAGVLFLTLVLGFSGPLWIIGQVVGTFLLFTGSIYEQGAYSSISDAQGPRKTIGNFGIAIGFTTGVTLGTQALVVLHIQPAVVALATAVISVVATQLAHRPLIKWVAAARREMPHSEEHSDPDPAINLPVPQIEQVIGDTGTEEQTSA
jgi:hypothetical protein